MKPLQGIPVISLSPTVVAIDRFLCAKYPKTEWCGILFYEEKGSINDPNNFTIDVKYLYPMDVGTGSSTSIDSYEEVVEAIKHKPELEKMKQGFIHSHHGMDTFFSGTDQAQLINGANIYDYFLSVITNSDQEYIARISFNVVSSETVIGKNGYKIINDAEVGYFDCDVNLGTDNIDEFLHNRIKEIDKNRTVGTYTTSKYNYFTLDKETNQAGFLNYDSYGMFNIEPSEFINEELLTLYSKTLLDSTKFDIDELSRLVEHAYGITIEDKLNEKQTIAKIECAHNLLNKVFAAHGMINNHKETERDDFFEYYKRMFSNNKFKHIRSVYEEIEWTIELSNVYDDYTPMVAFYAFKEAYNTLLLMYEQPGNYNIINMIDILYCSVFAHISTRSKHYKATQVDMLQDITRPVLFDDAVIDQYSFWLPYLKAQSLEMPMQYYTQFY